MPRPIQAWRLAALLVAAIAFPFAAEALGAGYYVGVGTRVMIYALAASSLNLVLGYGGMISFGHAAFFGAGAYAVAILAQEGVGSALVAWPVAVTVSVLCALVVGAISLRTRGLYFIMITLAFAQMLYYFFVSLKAYGGEDGINLAARSRIPRRPMCSLRSVALGPRSGGGSKPRPSSLTSRTIRPPCMRRSTFAAVTSAWRRTFESASCRMR